MRRPGDRSRWRPTADGESWSDPVTQLGSRGWLAERASRAIALARRRSFRVALVSLDVRRLSRVGATNGCGVGDRVLRSVAGRLRTQVRESDILARVGESGFVVLLTEVDGPEGAREGTRRLEATLDEPVTVDGEPIDVELSSGVALFPEHGQEFEELLRVASKGPRGQIDRSPGDGRGVEPDGEKSVLRPAATELRGAVERGELVLHYQPIFRLADGRTEGMEALVRWRHPRRGVLAAESFVHLAERLDLLREIDDWVLERVVEDLGGWAEHPRPRWVSVNLSAATLRDPLLTSRLCALLPGRSEGRHEENGPPRLVVEISERTAALDFESVARLITRLHALGVGAALDDFGTGHFSPFALGRLAVDFLKLDRRYLTGVDCEGRKGDVTAAILRLGHALEAEVIVEGVERTSQLEWLQSREAELVQGYFTGEPAPLQGQGAES